MPRHLLLPPLVAALFSCSLAAHAGDTPEIARIVIMRHAEKPPAGLGQLSCKGLQRALALPDVLIKLFGRPDVIMAPNPGHAKKDHGIPYAYLRPLATIEPAAVRLEMPVDIELGFDETAALREKLLHEAQKPATVWVAWEHRLLPQMERELLGELGLPNAEVPDWGDADFDRLDVIEVSRDAQGHPAASYKRLKQDLNGLPDSCPH
jgi:hypothetical protein